MPGGLEFDEVPDFVDALSFLRVPVDILLCLPRLHSLHRLRCAELELLPLVSSDDSAHSTQVGVRRERRHELAPETGEEIDYPAREIRSRQHLTENDCRVRPRLGSESDHDVAAYDDGRNLTHQP